MFLSHALNFIHMVDVVSVRVNGFRLFKRTTMFS